MRQVNLSPPQLGFVVGTRALLALGVGLLLADFIPQDRRRRIAFMLIGMGAVTTVPAARTVLRTPPRTGPWTSEAQPAF